MKKAPASYTALPAAPGEDPVLPGITMVSSSDRGRSHEWRFSIHRGDEDAAVNGLLDSLDATTSFSLPHENAFHNDIVGIYEWQDGKIKYTLRGHGWGRDPEILDRAAAFGMARSQAPFNYGPPKGECGFFERQNPGYRQPVEPEPRYTPFQMALGWLMSKLFR